MLICCTQAYEQGHKRYVSQICCWSQMFWRSTRTLLLFTCKGSTFYPISLIISPVLVFLTHVASPNGTIFHSSLLGSTKSTIFPSLVCGCTSGMIFRYLLMGLIVSSLDEGSVNVMSFPSFLMGHTTGMIFCLLEGHAKRTMFPNLLQRSPNGMIFAVGSH